MNTKRIQPYLLSLLRIVAGFLFIAHGLQKVLGMLGGQTVPFGTRYWVAGWLELLGGALLILGLWTRPVAFVLSGMMAAAYFLAHAPQGFWPVVNKGELAALYCFVFLYLAAAGGGPLSLDKIARRKN